METTKKNIESANVVKNATAEATALTAPNLNKKGKETKPKSEAQRKAEELQKEMERKQKELAECLKVLEAKKELSAKRSTFIDTLDKINTAEEVLNEDPIL